MTESAAAVTTGTREATRLFHGKLWFWLPIVPLVALDLWSKAAVFAFLSETFYDQPEQFRRYMIWGAPVYFDFVAWRNPGTIWGLGKDFTMVLIGLRAVALAVITYFAWRTPSGAKAQQFVLGLIMAGAIGNLYDNLTQPQNAVRDFLLFYVRSGNTETVWPAFNVADACICVGAIVLALLLWRSGAPAQPAAGDGRSAS